MKDWMRYGKWAVTAFVTVCAILVFYDTFYQSSALWTLLKKTMEVLAPVIYGVAMAYLLSPVVSRFERLLTSLTKGRKGKYTPALLRAGSLLLTWLCVGLGVYLLMSVLVPQLVESLQTLLANAESYYNTVYKWGNSLLEKEPQLAQWILDLLQKYQDGNIISGLVPRLQDLLTSVTGGIWLGVWGTLNFAKNLIIGIIISLYVLARKEKSKARACKAVYSILPEERAAAFLRGVGRLDAIFSGFIRGKLLDSLIIGILCFIGCSVLNLPYTPLVSVVVGVTNVIPFFGPFLGAIPSAFLILLVDPLKCLYFVIFVLLLQQLDGNVIGPKILGDSTGISGFWVIVSILVGGGFFGVLGMFLAVPTCAALQVLVKYLMDRRLRRRGMPLEAWKYVGRSARTEQTPPAVPPDRPASPPEEDSKP